MKYTMICPKCGSNQIIRIPGEVGIYGAGNNIMPGNTIFSAISVTRYLCCYCGFSEEWIEDRAGIEKLRKKYGANG